MDESTFPGLRPTLARIFLAGLVAGGLATRLVADEVPVGDIRRPEAHDQLMMEITVARGIEDDDDFDPDGGTGTTGRTPGGMADEGFGGDGAEDLLMPKAVPQDFGVRMPDEARQRPTVSTAAPPAASVEGRTVTYHQAGDTRVEGYLVTPGRWLPGRPAVVVIHEWWGLNDQVRVEAVRLGEAGYLALAVDLYKGKAAQQPAEAKALMMATRQDMAGARANLLSALRFLRQKGAGKVGSLGWCMGGAYSLQLALAAGRELDAAVMYYGHTVTDPAELAPLRAPLLGLFGEDDSGITPSLPAFRSALDQLAKPHAIWIYPGAGHAFANPNNTKNHNAEYARDAWGKTMSFLRTFLVQED